MRRNVLVWLGLLAFAPLLWAEKPKTDKPNTPTPEAEYQALVKEYENAQQEFFKLYREAKTPGERDKLYKEKYPNPDKYADRFIALAKKYEKQPVAADALAWVLTNSRGFGAEAEKKRTEIIDVLIADHLQSEKLAKVCESLAYNQSPAGEKLLRATLEKSKSPEVQAWACFSLALYLKNLSGTVAQIKTEASAAQRVEQFYGKDIAGKLRERDAGRLSKESEDLFQRVIDKFADVKRYPNAPAEYAKMTLGKAAEGELFEIRHLAIGKTAPEIEAEDIDGKKFKLSDYRGKVVMIDFWGHW